LNPTSIYAHLADSDKDLYNVTGLLPVPAGPAGPITWLDDAEVQASIARQDYARAWPLWRAKALKR